jgi:hypothetical protein
MAMIVSLETLASSPMSQFDRQGVERRLGLPVGVGHDRDGVAVDREDLLHARHFLTLLRRRSLEFAAEHRAGAIAAFSRPGSCSRCAVDLLAGELLDRVEPLQRLAGDLPVLRVLELDVLRRLELRAAAATLP